MRNKWAFYAGAVSLALTLSVISVACCTQGLSGMRTKEIDGVQYAYRITNGVAIIGIGWGGDSAIPTNTTGAVKIPSELDGCPVEIIAPWAFSGCVGVTDITIPNSVTNIRLAAFFGCRSLKSITIPKSVTFIEGPSLVFDHCGKLETIFVEADNPNYKSVDGVLFDKAGTNLLFYPRPRQGAYAVPEGVENIGGRAFAGCDGLTAVTLPASVTRIQNEAFVLCSNLISVALNEGLRSIQDSAFRGCTRLSTITLPKSLENVGKGVFGSCHSLKAISIDMENPKYSSVDGVLLTKDMTVLAAYPAGKEGAYAVPDTVTTLGRSLFNGNNGLTTLAIPASVKWIDPFFATICPALTSVTINPANPNFASIDGVLFDKACTNLWYYPRGRQGAYTIPNNARHLAASAFSFCNGLTAVTISDGIREIPFCAFAGCKNLAEVTIPNSVTNVNPAAFYECANITSVTIPPCVTNLKETFPHSYEKITNVVRLAAQSNRSSGNL